MLYWPLHLGWQDKRAMHSFTLPFLGCRMSRRLEGHDQAFPMKKISVSGTSGHVGIAMVCEVHLAMQQFGAVGIICKVGAVHKGRGAIPAAGLCTISKPARRVRGCRAGGKESP
jgi:hypothetical protein